MGNLHGPCPFVGCESSDAFSFNSNGYGKCWRCDRRYPSREPLKDWAAERYPVNSNLRASYPSKADNENADIMSFVPKAVKMEASGEGVYKGMRGIRPSVMEKFGVKTYDDRQEYTYPSGGIKVRTLEEKGFYAKNQFKGDELFGMNLFPAGCAKVVTVTEGELDALSAYQMLDQRYLNPVVSLPSANPSKKLWEKCSDWLNSFPKIILSVDTDEAGNALASKMAKMFPNKVYRVDHGDYKDANEILLADKEQEFSKAWWGAQKYTPENILNTTDQFLSLYRDTPEHQYVPTGIQDLDDKILGLMQGHFTVIKAPTGIGKTEVMRFLEYNMIQRSVPIATWHLEETKLRSLLGLVSYHLSDNLTRRDLIDEKNANDLVEQAIKDLTKDELLYQFYLGDGQGAEELLEQIRFFSQACGCKFVFFEPIQDVVVGSSEESKEAMLADLSIRLSKLAAELNVGIVTIAHTNENGDMKYCKMIGQRASVIVSLHRDKESDDYQERNTTYLRVEKNRPCSEEGSAGMMRFNSETFTLREV
jgi:twinkle protein